jgi:hypothetical protein
MIPTYEELRAAGRQPRLHGNGFLQIDLDDQGKGGQPGGKRLHVWHPLLPKAQAVSTPIHDHVFELESRVYLGKLRNTVYMVDTVGPVFKIYQAVPTHGSNTHLKDTGATRFLVEECFQELTAGSRYSLRAGVFHTSTSEVVTMTVMTKGHSNQQRGPRIAVPYGLEPDNLFDREKPDKEQLWWCLNDAICHYVRNIAP